MCWSAEHTTWVVQTQSCVIKTPGYTEIWGLQSQNFLLCRCLLSSRTCSEHVFWFRWGVIVRSTRAVQHDNTVENLQRCWSRKTFKVCLPWRSLLQPRSQPLLQNCSVSISITKQDNNTEHNNSCKTQAGLCMCSFFPPSFNWLCHFGLSAFARRLIKIIDRSKTLAQHLNFFFLGYFEVNCFHVVGQTPSRSLSRTAVTRAHGDLPLASAQLHVTLAAARCDTHLRVRRTAAGRCCSPAWWWTTASPHGCTRSPWKRNTWTRSPPLLERRMENVGMVGKNVRRTCTKFPQQMHQVHFRRRHFTGVYWQSLYIIRKG